MDVLLMAFYSEILNKSTASAKQGQGRQPDVLHEDGSGFQQLNLGRTITMPADEISWNEPDIPCPRCHCTCKRSTSPVAAFPKDLPIIQNAFINIKEAASNKSWSKKSSEKDKKQPKNSGTLLRSGSDPSFTKTPRKDQSDKDITRINTVIQNLETCCFYYDNISRQDARALLKSQSVGTFLLRTSTDPRYLFTLSVNTIRGPTSVRIQYQAGKYRLDCDKALTDKMPNFDCVLQLVDYYVKLSHSNNSGQYCMWLESSARNEVPIKLLQPLRKQTPSLQHLCRLKINEVTKTRDIGKLQIPKSIKAFLLEYPYLM